MIFCYWYFKLQFLIYVMSREGKLNIREKVIVHIEEELANTFSDMKVIVFIIKRNGAVKI